MRHARLQDNQGFPGDSANKPILPISLFPLILPRRSYRPIDNHNSSSRPHERANNVELHIDSLTALAALRATKRVTVDELALRIAAGR